MRTGYTGHDNIARSVQKIYLGINNKAKKCVRAYAGVDGIAKLIYPVDQPIPTVSGIFTYDRDVHEAVISEYDDEMIKISGVTKTSNAGTYTITFTLKSSMYRWSDGTNTPKTGTWTINKKVLSIPYIIPGTYTYNGTIQSASISEYDPYGVVVSGEPTASDAGTHNVKFNLSNVNNYIWTDNTVEEKSDSWSIAPVYVTIPAVTGAYTYSTKSQSAVISYASGTSNLITESGIKSATNAGTYTVFFDLKDYTNYRWNNTDKPTSQQKRNWTIAKAALDVPTLSASSKTYSGSSQSVTVSGYDKNTMTQSGDTSGTVVATYNVRFDLKDSSNYKWSTGDASVAYRVVSWQIVKAPVTIPTISENKTYSGAKQSPTLVNFNSSLVSKGGEYEGINANTYTITFNLIDKANYKWNDAQGTTSEKSATWYIYKRTIKIPSVSENKTYNGKEQSPGLVNYDSNNVRLSNNKKTHAGNYTIYFDLIDSANNKWNDAQGTTTQKSDSWSIAKASVDVPSVTNRSFTYNGSAQGPTVAKYDTNVISEPSNSVKNSTNAGTYYVRFNLVNTTDYQWSIGGTGRQDISWTIAKATLTISITNFKRVVSSGVNRCSADISAKNQASVSTSCVGDIKYDGTWGDWSYQTRYSATYTNQSIPRTFTSGGDSTWQCMSVTVTVTIAGTSNYNAVSASASHTF